MADIRCPTCGHTVGSIFDHVHIDCEHDMSEEEIAELLRQADEEEPSATSSDND